MGTKHGVWFDLAKHLAIHSSVIQKFNWFIRSGASTYNIQRFKKKEDEIIKHSILFETKNGYQVEIAKETLISPHDDSIAMTVNFSYNCIKKSETYHLRYHSAHSNAYNPNAPWHDKPHRHELNGLTKTIDVYSHDHRPIKDKNLRYSWKGYPVKLIFLNHEEWPFISEFLDEVSHLS